MNQGEIKSLLDTCRSQGLNGHRALGRLLRMVDDESPDVEFIDESIRTTIFKAARLGLTGPPGAGKSTLISSFLEAVARHPGCPEKIGILAVDPTSPFTGGALLGDRVRMKSGFSERVFFRSLASRGAMGGVSRSVWASARLLDWWGADLIIIETVGSGQLGTGVADVADLVVAVLTPEAGDGIQSMKAGIMELADCFVINKNDRPGSDLMRKELGMVREEASSVGRSVEIFSTNAVDGTGIDEFSMGVLDFWRRLDESGEIRKRRLEQVRRELMFRTETHLHNLLIERMGGTEKYRKTIDNWAARVFAGESTISSATRALDGS